MSQSLLRRRWFIPSLLVIVVFVIEVITLPAQNYGADTAVSQEEARSLITRGVLHVNKSIATSYGAPGQYFVLNPRNGYWYAKYGIFNALVDSVPLYAENLIDGRMVYGATPNKVLIQGIYYALIAAAIAYGLYVVTGYYSRSQGARVTYVLLAIYATYLWYYFRSTTAEVIIFGCFLLFYIFFLRFVRSKKSITEKSSYLNIYVAWAAILLAVNTRLYTALWMPVFILALLYSLWKQRIPKKKWFKVIVLTIVVPSVIIFLSLGIVQWVKFGSPFLSGYHQWWDLISPHTLIDVLYDFIVSPQWSFFFNFPLLILALFGAYTFVRHNRDESVFLALIFLIFFFFIQYQSFWRGEWAYGPRYFVYILPILSLPALYVFEWMYKQPFHTLKVICLVFVFGLSALFIRVQFQIAQSPFFLRYDLWNSLRDRQAETKAVFVYFTRTPYAKIYWDHIALQNTPNALPYFNEVTQTLNEQDLEQWKRDVKNLAQQSNLYWFPNINKR